MENVIITYDISNDQRRNRVFKTLKDYGIHVQYSVFECRLRKEDYLLLRCKLEGLIKKDEDNVIFYRICRHCLDKVERVGRSIDPIGEGIYII